MMEKSLFELPTLDLAKALLGKKLKHETSHGVVSGKIIEVEAYKGPEDRAAHSFSGKRTKRTQVMYGPPGFTYLYIIYGIHLCFNIVSGPINKPEAILIRALEPLEGRHIMSKHRFQTEIESLNRRQRLQLTNGPGKLTQALGIK